MSDRFVRQIDPLPKDEVVTPKRMSEYGETANIVLVGDPGAGKSHLFEELAQAAKTIVQSARAFLNTPPGSAGATLFIDALDERRAGRSDQATIDLIVQKLFTVNAKRVRLACREHDWLGGTDLAAFHPYFAQSGRHVVLALEALTEAEQRDILGKTGVPDPQEFIKEAERRGLSEFLINPQNLIMLAEVVLKKAWPATRRDLLEDTTVLLLKEHNLAHVRSRGGRHAVSEVRPPASAACALRLISDVEGISLSEAEVDPLYPSYRTIPFANPELTLASLGRRTFRALGNEAVDYSHRVRAEYAAAGWLAQQIRNGLPLSRVQSLIGIDGVPAPELRGMHAWLAVLLPECSDVIIDADPFGVLIYSDPNSLSLTQRLRLVQALSRLAAADRYFRPQEDAPAAINALCEYDMVPHLKKILQDAGAPFGIKLLLLEGLGSALPLPALQKEIVAVVADPAAPFGLKVPAMRAAARLGPTASKAMVKIYRGLGESADDIRLSTYILSKFYVGNFSAKDVSDLYNAAIRCKEELLTGVLWQIATSIPTHDIPLVLDAVVAGREPGAKLKDRKNRHEFERFIERLVVRALQERADGVSGQRVWAWLEMRSALRGDDNSRKFEAIKPLLAERTELTRAIFEAAVDGYTPTLFLWRFGNRLREYLPFSFSSEPLRWLTGRLVAGIQDANKRNALYELALSWVYGNPEGNVDTFEALYLLADAAPDLLLIRNKLLANDIQGWQAEDKQRAAAELEKRRAGRLKNLQQFARDIAEIKDGIHLGWMIWTADVYFANFSDVDSAKSPRERLEDELGPENTVTVLDGLKALVRVGTLPSLQDLVAADSKNSYPKLWYAFLAGMDELWLETPSVAVFSDDALKVLVGIDLLLPTSSRHASGMTEQDAHAWKDHILSSKPALVRDTYLYLAEAGLKEDKEHISGFYALLNDAPLAPFRGEIATYLLETYPNLLPQRLEELLQIALTQSPETLVLDLARKKLDPATPLSEEQRLLWALAAYLLSPNTYQAALESLAKNTPSIVWRMRALTSYDRDSNNQRAFAIKPRQQELFARIAASHFQNAGHPTGGWSGDENAWDAADYIGSLLSALSADKSVEATEALQQLALDPAMVTYVDSIKHALANQRARYREMTYKQPNWTETIATLSGGAPANVADLQALVVEHLQEISKRIGTQNIDVYKDFWNEDSHGRPVDPKIEESARNVLLGLLKTRLYPLGVIAEPEGHMVADKRADITAALPGRKLILELKRDIHAELWSAPATQLDRFYTRDPEASGYGVFGVFWYGNHRQGRVPKHPKGKTAPKTALELETMLNDIIVAEQRIKLRAVVIDVSVPDGQRVGAARLRRKKPKPSKPKTSLQKSATKKKAPVKSSKPKAGKGSAKKTPRAQRKAKARAGRAKGRGR
jgi:hypothetical protein